MVLNRDNLCDPPLYYWVKDPKIHGPSVRALLDQGVPRKLSREGFWSYMLCGAVQEPFTLIEDVQSSELKLRVEVEERVEVEGLPNYLMRWRQIT